MIIKLNLWDLSGQERYRSLLEGFYRGMSLCVISYRVNYAASFSHIIDWLKEAKSHCKKDCKFFLIGNQADDKDNREVEKEEGEKIAKEYNFDLFVETSSKLGLNVKYIFIQAAKILYLSFLEIKNTKKEENILTKIDKKIRGEKKREEKEKKAIENDIKIEINKKIKILNKYISY